MEQKRTPHQFAFIRKQYPDLNEEELEKADYAAEAYVRLVRHVLNKLKDKEGVDSKFDSLDK